MSERYLVRRHLFNWFLPGPVVLIKSLYFGPKIVCFNARGQNNQAGRSSFRTIFTGYY